MARKPLEFVRFAITFAEDVPVAIMQFITKGESPTLPSGAAWIEPGYWVRFPTEENLRAELAKTFWDGRLTPVSWRRISADEIPTNRRYRDAWVDNGKIEHDMPKARGIHLTQLRSQRERRFKDLDAAWMYSMDRGLGAEAARIGAERQALRDAITINGAPGTLSPAIEAAQTVEELAAVELP